MLKEYKFRIEDWGDKDRIFMINDHKVHSAVFTTLYYKVSNNDSYKTDYKMTHEFSKNEYFHKTIETRFILRGA